MVRFSFSSILFQTLVVFSSLCIVCRTSSGGERPILPPLSTKYERGRIPFSAFVWDFLSRWFVASPPLRVFPTSSTVFVFLLINIIALFFVTLFPFSVAHYFPFSVPVVPGGRVAVIAVRIPLSPKYYYCACHPKMCCMSFNVDHS